MMTLWKCAIRNRLLCSTKSAPGTASSTPRGGVVADAAAEHREQPVEQLHAGGNRNDRRHDAEESIHVGARAHGEEVVQPDEERQDADGRRGVHNRLVAEQRLARERRDNFRECAERRQDQDVDLGVAPDPDQVDVHHRVSTKLVGEEMHVEVPVHGQQRQGRLRST
ncbi:hypothetical protein G6F62_014108 [Rhizopus arrhizus]|nr:hypothetical protein G6F62_014108 [Rhizopus arrhizus]